MKATITSPPARADDLKLCLCASIVDTLQRGGNVFDLTATVLKLVNLCNESAAQASRSADCCTCDVNALRACQAS